MGNLIQKQPVDNNDNAQSDVGVGDEEEDYLDSSLLEYDEVVVAQNLKLKVQFVEPPKFEFDDDKALSYLEDNGYVVFKNMATKEEIETGIDLFWRTIETQTNNHIRRDDPLSWTEHLSVDDGKDYFFPGGNSVGIVGEYGIGQSPFLWHARGLKKVSDVFKRIWNTNDVITSFDGASVFRPGEFKSATEKRNNWVTSKGWFHIDQNGYHKVDRRSVQGLLNFYESQKDDGGLLVVRSSHKLFNKLFDEYKIGSPKMRDFIAVDQYRIDELWNKNTEILKCCLSPGDFILWDSRTVHCSHPAKHLNRVPDQEVRLRRLVAYVCMTPTSFIEDEELIQKRINAFKKIQTTTHWPHEFHKCSTYHPPHSWNYPVLSTLQKELLVGIHNVHLLDDDPFFN